MFHTAIALNLLLSYPNLDSCTVTLDCGLCVGGMAAVALPLLLPCVLLGCGVLSEESTGLNIPTEIRFCLHLKLTLMSDCYLYTLTEVSTVDDGI